MASSDKTTNCDGTGESARSKRGRRKSLRIDFGDKNKKPQKTGWDKFSKKFDEGDIKPLSRPERRTRFNRLTTR